MAFAPASLILTNYFLPLSKALYLKDITVLNKVFIICFWVVLLSGCNDDDIESISMEYFEKQVIDIAGEGAIFCGEVDINEPTLVVNTCISDSYILNIPFYSFYLVQGDDSIEAYAVTMDASSKVLYWSYDNFLGGNIATVVCENPSVTSELTGAHTDVFICSE